MVSIDVLKQNNYYNSILFVRPRQKTEATQMQVYVRHWHPSTYTVDKTQEIILSGNSPEHLKLKVREDLYTNTHTHIFIV